MTPVHYILRSLSHYRVAYLGALAGAILGATVLLGALFASLSGVIGLYLSYYLSIASGAAIVLTATLFFLLAFLGKKIKER